MNYRETLTAEEVEEIRRLGKYELLSEKELAFRYEVPRGHIRFILNRYERQKYDV